MVLHAKYCFMPNKLGGCGIQTKTTELFEYAAAEISDPGLEEILKTFEAAYPYLLFISRATGINNPFDKRVVEAYWIGNSLLDKIDQKEFYDWCFERYGKEASPKALKLLVGTVPLGAVPHHSFHVFNSYLRNRHFEKVLHFMNECRIATGKVTKISHNMVEVEYSPIIFGLEGFDFGDKETRMIYSKIGNKSFVESLKIDDCVGFHWGWLCDKLSQEQGNRLELVTLKQLKLFNKYI